MTTTLSETTKQESTAPKTNVNADTSMHTDSVIDQWIDTLTSPRNALIAAGIILVASTGLSVILVRRKPSTRHTNALPAHFRSASSLQRATSKTTPLGTTLASTTQRASKLPADEKIEPYSIEARRIGRSLAFKALGLGTLACLIVNGIAAWGIGRYLGVRNLAEFSDWCKTHIPQRTEPIRRIIYRDADPAEVNAIPFEKWSDIGEGFRIEREREKAKRQAAHKSSEIQDASSAI